MITIIKHYRHYEYLIVRLDDGNYKGILVFRDFGLHEITNLNLNTINTEDDDRSIPIATFPPTKIGWVNAVYFVKRMFYDPKRYDDRGRTVKWGEDLSEETMISMRDGEVFILLDKEGKPYKKLLLDHYNQLRESAIKPRGKS